MRKLFAILLLYISTAASPCTADIYAYVSQRGVIHLTNLSQHNSRYKFVMATPMYQANNGIPIMGNNITTGRYTSYIQNAAKKYGVSKNLVSAVIMTESGFNPNAVSPKGAQGLMQLMPSTAARFGVTDPFNVKQNINAGVQYLSILLDRFKSKRLAIAAYNAGAHAVEKYGNAVPPYAETRAYVPIVLQYEKKYQRIAGNKKAA